MNRDSQKKKLKERRRLTKENKELNEKISTERRKNKTLFQENINAIEQIAIINEKMKIQEGIIQGEKITNERLKSDIEKMMGIMEIKGEEKEKAKKDIDTSDGENEDKTKEDDNIESDKERKDNDDNKSTSNDGRNGNSSISSGRCHNKGN